MIEPQLVRHLSEVLRRWDNQLKKRGVPASIYKELLLPHRWEQPDLGWEQGAVQARAIAGPALRALLAPLASQHFGAGQSVLEVGAGTLDRGRSYVSRYFDHLPSLSWTMADAPTVARRAREQVPAERYLELNLTAAESPPRLASFDAAVASNVFDTLPYADFGAALETIRRMLKPGRVFLHVADLNFYVNAFLDACGAPGNVLFPSAESHRLIHVVPKDIYGQVLQASAPRLAEEERAFLETWGAQRPQIQAVVIGDAVLSKVDLSSLHRSSQTIFAGHLGSLQQVGLFQRSLVIAAARGGWSMLECGFRVAEVTLPRRPLTSGPFNRHELDEGTVIGRRDATLPEGQEKVRAKVHVFLARSP